VPKVTTRRHHNRKFNLATFLLTYRANPTAGDSHLRGQTSQSEKCRAVVFNFKIFYFPPRVKTLNKKPQLCASPIPLETNPIGIHLESNWKFPTIKWIPIGKCPLFPIGFQLDSNWVAVAFLIASARATRKINF
jgi:hypothetical protein